MAFKMKGFSGPFTQKSTISNEEAKGINIENISAVQNKGGKNFVVEVCDDEWYDPTSKQGDYIATSTDPNAFSNDGKAGPVDRQWKGNYNDTNNRRDTIVVKSSYKPGDLIDETDWEEGKAFEKKKKK